MLIGRYIEYDGYKLATALGDLFLSPGKYSIWLNFSLLAVTALDKAHILTQSESAAHKESWPLCTGDSYNRFSCMLPKNSQSDNTSMMDLCHVFNEPTLSRLASEYTSTLSDESKGI